MSRFPLLVVMVTSLVLSAAFAEDPTAEKKPAKKEFKFVGIGNCYNCHKGKKKGGQFEIWMASSHFKAYDTLATDKAKEVAKKRGFEGDPQEIDKCLKCHSRKLSIGKENADPKAKFSYKLKGKTVESLTIECETCHGPGSKYKTLKIMKDHKLCVENGLWDAKKRCVSCHNAESDPDFDFKKAFPKIAHPVPEAEDSTNKKAAENN